MCQPELVALHAAATGQQPACKPLVDTVQPVAGSGLCGLHEETLYVPLQVLSQFAGAFKFLFQNVCLDTERNPEPAIWTNLRPGGVPVASRMGIATTPSIPPTPISTVAPFPTAMTKDGMRCSRK